MTGRLKSLELQGYKTFASRTDFVFADNITAIVGPNGSGKSNIADAIRWVLGEQTYSLLRAKRTEDMIFAGSEQRARAGMASATILFDNSDGWLPIDFSEVAITRRAYRDGENEYLVNNQRVRLKDVSELLAESGLAERTYTVIGQGLVDAALALKAEERRKLFEEAAGIGLHRSRREESLKRLETTRRNLERVEDILVELQPRLRSLERQSRRAQEYEQIKADLQILLRDWYGYHWHRAQKDLTVAQEIAHRQESQLERVREAQAKLDQQVDALRGRIREGREQLGTWHRESAELHSNREEISRKLAVANERHKALDEQAQTASSELVRLEGEITLEKERFVLAQEETANLQADYEDVRKQLDAARQDMDQRKLERQRAESDVDTARQKFTEQVARQEYLAKRLVERQALLEKQRGEQERSEETLRTSELELKQAKAELEKAIRNLTAAQDKRSRAENSLSAHGEKLAEAERVRKKSQAAVDDLQNQVHRLKAQADVIEQAERGLVGYASGARVLLQAMRQKRLNSPLGALTSQVEVPALYEKAIGAALGEFLDGVLFNEIHEAESAFEVLDQEATRGVLIPLEGMRGMSRVNAEPESAPELEGVIGWATGLVKIPEDLHTVALALLGKVLVVQSRDAARRSMQACQEQALGLSRVVTLDGDIFYPDGRMLVGPAKQAGVLSRPRQRRELREELDGVENNLKSAQQQASQQAREVETLMAAQAVLGKVLQEAEHIVRVAVEDRHRNALAVEKCNQRVGWQKEQLARQQDEVKRLGQEIQGNAEETRQLGEEIRQSKEVLRAKNEVLAELGLDELQTRLSHWSTRSAVQALAVKEAQNRLKERQDSLQRLIQNQSTIQGRVQDYKTVKEQVEEDTRTALQLEKELTAKLEALQASIQPAEVAMEQAELEQSSLQVKESEARQTFSQAEHLHAQARIALARRQEALDSLHNRIEDDFGLVAFRYVDTVSGQSPLPLDGLVEQLPIVVEIPAELEENVKRLRAQLRRIGPVNLEAHQEYLQVKERFEFMTAQVTDLHKAEEDLKQVISELDLLMEREFRKTFDAVAHEFRQVFTRLFGGGSAHLLLTSPEDITETGIDIEARLPGRREQGLSLLSGGERSLTAAALVFALLKVSPTPFCVLDEVDAMLDEVNVGRFRELLSELSANTQFVIITHNRNTVQAADVIYGVTMGHDSSSQIISLKLDEVSKVVD